MRYFQVLLLKKKKKKITVILDWKHQEKSSCAPQPLSRNEGEGLPEAMANIMLEIIEHSQTQVSNEVKKPLQKQ